MKQTVFISVHDRQSSSIFRVDFNPEMSEANQIIGFLESKKLDSKIFDLTKSFEYDPVTKFFIPHFTLVELEIKCMDLCSEVENEKE